MVENTFHSQPDPPALSPDSGDRFTEADLDAEETRRHTMLTSANKKSYTAEEFHRELAARLVDQARREREASDRKAQRELITRFDQLAVKVDKANNLKVEISDKVDFIIGRQNTIIQQNAATSKAFGVDKMSEDDKSAAPAVLRAYQDRQRTRASGMYQWQRLGVVVGIFVGMIVAAAAVYNAILGVAHPFIGH